MLDQSATTAQILEVLQELALKTYKQLPLLHLHFWHGLILEQDHLARQTKQQSVEKHPDSLAVSNNIQKISCAFHHPTNFRREKQYPSQEEEREKNWLNLVYVEKLLFFLTG